MSQNERENLKQNVLREKYSPTHLAGGLLVCMGAVAVGTTWLSAKYIQQDNLFLDLIRAGSKAGVVGGLADWFAIVALFRHPLGIPIPHTAILPRQKKRLGESLGRFISEQFFTDENVRKVLHQIDLPKIIAETLDAPSVKQNLIHTLRSSIPGLLNRVEDGSAVSALSKVMSVLLNGEEMTHLVARGMKAMVESELHQEVLSFLLCKLKNTVAAREGDFKQFVEDRVREQGGRFLGWAIGASVSGRVLSSIKAEMDRVDPMDSEIRQGFTSWVRAEIDKMENDPERRNDISEAIGAIVTHSSLKAWSGELWEKLRLVIEDDSTREDGWNAAVLETTINSFIISLRENENLKIKINQMLEEALFRTLPTLRGKLSGFIANVMAGWDADVLTRRLEQGVGKDLTYIRINGTVFGFFAGAVLEALSKLIMGI
ncbi:DUF445 domain-containing protein [Swingsia samuiensis]|uniref:DUF445 domain-containing protein n=1 Tax=Swingsia samuiensis TaxID=1293412 RepID=A0A4Y6UIM4_9PROT|nr:DUF445 domain-containing protein [Swingsia samuiensis]QDH16221.1 DUF445 domain-containing protein [Swingsia samuiensis]